MPTFALVAFAFGFVALTWLVFGMLGIHGGLARLAKMPWFVATLGAVGVSALLTTGVMLAQYVAGHSTPEMAWRALSMVLVLLMSATAGAYVFRPSEKSSEKS